MSNVNVQVTGLVRNLATTTTCTCSEWVVVPSSAVGTPQMTEIINKRLQEKGLVRTTNSMDMITALHQTDLVVKDGRAQSDIYESLQANK